MAKMIRHWEDVVNKNGPVPGFRPDLGPCWIWTRHTKGGYGRWMHKRREKPVHVWSYEQYVGDIPKEYVIDHLCRVRACCNPVHLEAVTTLENLRRGFGWSGRNARKTHCKWGHELVGQNIYTPPGRRKCRPCAARRAEELRQRRRLAAC